MTEHPGASSGKPRSELPLRDLLIYALPALPLAALALPLSAYLPPFYAEDLGLGMGVVGAVFAGARLWDVVTDPIVGALSDRQWVSAGRRRPWVVASVPVLCVGTWLVFFPAAEVSAPILVCGLLVLYVGYTALSLSHVAWGAELSVDYDGRARVQGVREGVSTLGMLVAMLLPAVVEARGGDRAAQMETIGVYLLLTVPLTVAWTVRRTPEPAVTTTGSVPLRRALGRLWASAPLRRLLLADLIVGVGAGVTVSTYLFFADHVLGLGGEANRLLLLFFFAALVGVPLVLRASVRFGKHRTVAGALVLTALIMLGVLALGRGQLVAYAVLTAASGLAYSAGPILFKAIAADIAEVEADGTAPRTGLVFALLTLTAKVGPALAVGVTYALLGAVGFDPTSADNPEGAVRTLRLTYVLTPLVVCLGVAPLMWGFPLDRAALTPRTSLESGAPAAGSGR